MICLFLGACAEFSENRSSFRDLDAPFVASTQFDPALFAGDWYTVGGIKGTSGNGGFVVLRRRFAYDPETGRLAQAYLWPFHGEVQRIQPAQVFQVIGPGAIQLVEPKVAYVLSVLWVDAQHRTILLGQANGNHTMILDRNPFLSAERLEQIEAVLLRSGYRLEQLQLVR